MRAGIWAGHRGGIKGTRQHGWYCPRCYRVCPGCEQPAQVPSPASRDGDRMLFRRKTGKLTPLKQRHQEVMMSRSTNVRNKTLCALQDAGDEYEAQVIERLAIKLGWWWKCTPGSCGYVNLAEENTCNGCGEERS